MCGKPQRTHHTGEAQGSTPGSRPVSCRPQNKTWTDMGLERPRGHKCLRQTKSCPSLQRWGLGSEMVSMCCPWTSDSSTGERPPRAPLSSSGARLGPRVAARATQMELWAHPTCAAHLVPQSPSTQRAQALQWFCETQGASVPTAALGEMGPQTQGAWLSEHPPQWEVEGRGFETALPGHPPSHWAGAAGGHGKAAIKETGPRPQRGWQGVWAPQLAASLRLSLVSANCPPQPGDLEPVL